MNVRIPRVVIWIVLGGLVLMAGLALTGITLASRYSRATTTEVIGIEAQMSLSPTYGGANTFVNITGIGFPANTRVRLYLAPPGGGVGEQPHGETFSEGEGRFSAMFPMPAMWPDGTLIMDENLLLIATTEDGTVRANATFDFTPPVVQPEIGVNPTLGGAGTAVTVTSTGFPAGSTVNLHLGPPEGGYGPQVYSQGVADANGQVILAFSMPEQWPDGSRVKEEQLEIVTVTEDGSVRASSGFDYVPIPHPLMTVSPNYGGPGTPVTITGDGYAAGVRVLIKLGTSVEDAAGRTSYIETMADTRGNINLPFEMPGRWPTGLPILVRDVVVLATAADRSGYGWMGFAYLENLPPDEEDVVEAGSSADPGAEPLPAAPQDEGDSGNRNKGKQQTEPIVAEPEPLEQRDTEPPPNPEEPGQESPGEAQDEPLLEPVIVPAISLEPQAGGPDTPVTVIGSGFPAGAELFVLLGLPEAPASEENYGLATVDETGAFSTTFVMPSAWGDGSVIESEELQVTLVTSDFSSLATALFEFVFAPVSE